MFIRSLDPLSKHKRQITTDIRSNTSRRNAKWLLKGGGLRQWKYEADPEN